MKQAIYEANREGGPIESKRGVKTLVGVLMGVLANGFHQRSGLYEDVMVMACLVLHIINVLCDLLDFVSHHSVGVIMDMHPL